MSKYKIERGNNSSNEFYKLDKEFTNDTSGGTPKDAPKSLVNKLTKYSKNLFKSAKNLTVDVVGTYVPNAASFASSINDINKEVQESSKEKIAKIKEFVDKQKHNTSDSKKELEKSLKDNMKNIIARLKSGNLYESEDEKMQKSMDSMFDFGGMDDFNLGDISDNSSNTDSFNYESDDVSLGSEPFSEAPVQQISKKPINSSRNARVKNSTIINNVTSVKTSDSSQVRLGDELVAGVSEKIGTSLIVQNETLWSKTFAADELRFTKLMKTQNSILEGVNAISDHMQNVIGTSVAASMEYQAKTLLMNEETIGLLKDLKKLSIIASPEYGSGKSNESRLSKVLQNGQINSKEYIENVKSNFKDMIMGSEYGMAISMIPMLSSNLGMAKDMGGGPDPLNMMLKSGMNTLLSKKTRQRMGALDDMFKNSGGLAIGKLNEMANFGNSSGARLLGRLLGVKDNYAKQVDLGLKDPTQQVAWTSKSDRTLNEVIPHYLAEMTAVLTGKEQKSYDYSTGSFKTATTIKKEYETVRKAAYSNAQLSEFSTAMAANGKHDPITANISPGELKKDIDTITENVMKSNMNFSPENLQNKKYYEQLTTGVKHKEAMILFKNQFENMSANEQSIFNGLAMTQNAAASKRLSQYSSDLLKNGGASIAGTLQHFDEIDQLKRRLKYSRSLSLEDPTVKKDSALYVQRQQERSEIEAKIRKLELGGSINGPVQAVMTDASGMNIDTEDASGTVSNSMIGSLNNIFNLLSKGIIVYPNNDMANGDIPEHLKSIYSTQEKSRQTQLKKMKEDELENERVYGNVSEATEATRRFQRKAYVRMRDTSILEQFGIVDGNSEYRMKNPVNQAFAKGTNSAMNAVNKITGSIGRKTGNGILAGSDYYAEFEDDKQHTLKKIREAIEKLEINKDSKGLKGILARKALIQLRKQEANVLSRVAVENIDPSTGLLINNGIKEGKVKDILNKVDKTVTDIYSKYVGDSKSIDTLSIDEELNFLNEMEGNEQSSSLRNIIHKEKEAIIKNSSNIPQSTPSLYVGKNSDSSNFISDIKSKDTDSVLNSIDNIKDNETVLDMKSKKDSVLNDSSNFISDIKSKGKNLFDKGKTFVLTTIDNIKDNETISDIKSKGKNVLDNIKDNETVLDMKSKKDSVLNDSSNFISNMKSKGTEVLDNIKDNETILDMKSKGTEVLDNIKSDVVNKKYTNIFSNIRDFSKSSTSSISSMASGFFDKFKNNMNTNRMPGLGDGHLSSSEKEYLHSVALNTYASIDALESELTTNINDPKSDDPKIHKYIISSIKDCIKKGSIQKDIGTALISKVNLMKDKGYPPLYAFKEAKDALRKEYDKNYNKENFNAKPIIQVSKSILKTSGKGLLATGLLMSGHPLLAAGIVGSMVIKHKFDNKVAKSALYETGESAKRNLFSTILNPRGIEKDKTREDVENERKVALSTFAVIDSLQKEIDKLIGSDTPRKEDGSYDTSKVNLVYKLLDEQVASGTIDRAICENLKMSIKTNITKGYPISYSFEEAKNSIRAAYDKRYKKDKLSTNKALGVSKSILKGIGTSTLAAGLLLTGHPFLAAGLTTAILSKSKSFNKFLGKKLDNRNVKNKVKSSLREKAAALSGGMSPFDSILGIKPEDKLTNDELERESKIAANAFTVLKKIYDTVVAKETNTSYVDGKEIIAILNQNMKDGILDKDIGSIVINRVNDTMKEGEPASKALLEAIETIKKNYSKMFKSQKRKRSAGWKILKGIGTGIGAAGLLLSGHPLLAAGLVTRSIMKSNKLKKDMKENGIHRDKIAKIRGTNDTPIFDGDISTIPIETGEEKRKEGLFGKFKTGSQSLVNKTKANVVAFGNKFKKSPIDDVAREGSLLDSISDKKEKEAENRSKEQVESFKTMTDTLNDIKAGMGFTDSGEMDEKNKKGVSFLLGNIALNTAAAADNTGGGSGKGGSFVKSLIKTASVAGAAITIGSAVRGATQTVSAFKNEGVVGGLATAGGSVFGANGDSDFNPDGSKKGRLGKALDKQNIAKNVIQTGQSVLMNQGSTAKIGQLVADSLQKLGKNKSITKLLGKFASKFNSFCSSIASKINNGIAKAVGKVGGNVGKKLQAGLSKNPELISYLITAAAFAVSAAISGWGLAGRYFKVPADKVTTGMKVTSAMYKALRSILDSILNKIPGLGIAVTFILDLVLPDSETIQFIYKIFADEKAEAELMKSQQELIAKAEELGVDPDRLNEVENKGFMDKLKDVFQSKDKEDARYAKKLGLVDADGNPDASAYKAYREKQKGITSTPTDTKVEAISTASGAGVLAGGVASNASTVSKDAIKNVDSSSKAVLDKTSNTSKSINAASIGTAATAVTGIGGSDLMSRAMDVEKDLKPKTAESSVKLVESPMVTNDKMLINVMNQALDIQKQIKDEMIRHNGVSESFFTYLIDYFEKKNKKDKKEELNKNTKGFTSLFRKNADDNSSTDASSSSLEYAMNMMFSEQLDSVSKG